MHRFLRVTPAYRRAHTVGQPVTALTLAALLLAFLVAPAMRAAGTVRAGHLAPVAPATGLTKFWFATAAAALPGTEEMLVSFALALATGLLLVITAELVWRFSRRPGSRP